MYHKESREKVNSSSKAGGIVILPLGGNAPQDALAAVCDGCGAVLWIPNDFADMLNEANHRTMCQGCLKVRKVV